MNKTAEHAVRYAELSGKTLSVAVKIAEQYEQELKAADRLIPTVVEQLRRANLIDASQVKQAEQELTSHGDCMQILSNVIETLQKRAGEQRAKEASATLGGPEPAEQSTTKYANWVGRRRGSDDGPAESDIALFRGLGLGAPSSS